MSKFKIINNEVVSLSFSRKLSYLLKEEMYDFLSTKQISLKEFANLFFSNLSDLNLSHSYDKEEFKIVFFKFPKKDIILRFENLIKDI